MNGRTAKLIDHATAHANPVLRRALKREWLATPRNQRRKMRGRIRHMMKMVEAHQPTVEEILQARDQQCPTSP